MAITNGLGFHCVIGDSVVWYNMSRLHYVNLDYPRGFMFK